ncbi:hypothetical protein COOONC_14774 [Cooperia oncophora]
MKIALALLFVAVTAVHSSRHSWAAPLPPYLRNVDEKAKEQLLNLITNIKLGSGAKKRLIEKWAQKHGILEEVKRFIAEMEKNARKARTAFTMLIDEVIPIALKNYTTVVDNENQTIEEMIQKMQAMEAEHPEVGEESTEESSTRPSSRS